MKNVKVLINDTKGITLVALVITIIVMLILAGVSLNVLIGDNGILTQASTAKIVYGDAEEKEQVDMAIAAAQVNTYPEIDYYALNRYIKDVFGEESKVKQISSPEEGKFCLITLPNGHMYSTISKNIFDIFIPSNESPNESGIGVTGYMLELDQKIGLRFHFVFPEEQITGGEVIKIYQQGKEEPIIETNLSDILENKYKEDENEYYYVTAYVDAASMTRSVTFKIDDVGGNNIYISSPYTIRDYGMAIINDTTNNYASAKVEYIKALLNYGGKTQVYLASITPDVKLEESDRADYELIIPTIDVKTENVANYRTARLTDHRRRGNVF